MSCQGFADVQVKQKRTNRLQSGKTFTYQFHCSRTTTHAELMHQEETEEDLIKKICERHSLSHIKKIEKQSNNYPMFVVFL